MRGQKLTAALWAKATFDDEACGSCANTGGQRDLGGVVGFSSAGITFNLSSTEHRGLT